MKKLLGITLGVITALGGTHAQPVLRKLHIPSWDLESWNQALLDLLRR